MLNALDLAGIPLNAADRDLDDPVVVAGGHAAFNPEPIADFVDCAVLGDGEQAVLEITEVVRSWKADGRERRPRGAAVPARDRGRRRLRPALLRRRLPAGRPHPAGPPEPRRRAVPRREADRDGPRRVAVPEAAAGAARGDRARADERRDLPRLHARLPVLPGRHDHAAGPRAVASPASARWSSAGSPRPATRRSGCCRCRAPTTPRSATIAKGLADRYEGTQTSLSLPDDAGRRVQHRPGQRADPQRPPDRTDVRPRGRLRAAAARSSTRRSPRRT